jgi:hypothetical protein
LIELPPLPPRDRKAVLRRKAAALAGCAPEEVIFTASLQASAARGATEPGDRWLIVALRRSFASELLSSLRTRGIRIARVVSLRLAPLREALAGQRARNLDSGCVVVAVEPQATTVSLVAGAALVSQSTLTGSIAARPKLARALLQEIRSIDSFWRKTHRGSGVTEVAWIGLAAERGEPLRAALQTALPDARVHALVTEAAARGSLLAACSSWQPADGLRGSSSISASRHRVRSARRSPASLRRPCCSCPSEWWRITASKTRASGWKTGS